MHVREIYVRDMIIYFYAPLLLLIGTWISYFTFLPNEPYILVICILLSYVFLRFISIGAVLLYKAYAPMEVRNRCRYTPTCSTYMIICLKRYGLIIGLTKGLRRISRCKPPYGGIDWPYLFKKPQVNNVTVDDEDND